MFIIENGKISGQKTLDIGKVRIINLTFKSDLTFADDDKFKLVLGSIQSENYAFVDDGCFRFSYVDVGSLITSSSNDLSITITKNGQTILTDTITLVATVQGGGSDIDLSDYATKDFVIENAPIKTVPITLGCDSYDNDTKTGTLTVGDGEYFSVSTRSGEILTLTYAINSEYDISPNDEFCVVFNSNSGINQPITAKLYLNDQLIRQGLINGVKLYVNQARTVIGLNTNYKDGILKNNIGKTLKLQILFTSSHTSMGTIQFTKNIPIYGLNQIDNTETLTKFVERYTDKRDTQYYSSNATTSISFDADKKNQFMVPHYLGKQLIQNLTLSITSKSCYNLTYIIETAQTFTYTTTIGSDFYLNKPLDLQPNKTYAICQYYKYIFWTQLTAYGA